MDDAVPCTGTVKSYREASRARDESKQRLHECSLPRLEQRRTLQGWRALRWRPAEPAAQPQARGSAALEIAAAAPEPHHCRRAEFSLLAGSSRALSRLLGTAAGRRCARVAGRAAATSGGGLAGLHGQAWPAHRGTCSARGTTPDRAPAAGRAWPCCELRTPRRGDGSRRWLC